MDPEREKRILALLEEIPKPQNPSDSQFHRNRRAAVMPVSKEAAMNDAKIAERHKRILAPMRWGKQRGHSPPSPKT